MSSLIQFLGGQWLVFFKGKQAGHGLLSFNSFGDSGGYVSLYQDENILEKTPTLLLQGRVNVSAVSQQNFVATARENNSVLLNQVTIEGRRPSETLTQWVGEWRSTAGYSGEFEMIKLTPRRLEVSEVQVVSNWNQFSDWVFSQEPESFVYRGLGDRAFLLESTAHRAGIFNLHHYLVEVLPRVRAELLKRHGLRIDVSSPDGLAEILALIRHHGFPSPIMDWSKSPWVALYFALTSAILQTASSTGLKYCRVYCLRHNGISVIADVKQALLAPNLSGSFAEIPTPMTSRVTAQEGVFLLTPCVDVVTTFLTEGNRTNQQLISAVDIAGDVANEFLGRLDRMMINEATMLSNIDSTLNHLRRRLIK